MKGSFQGWGGAIRRWLAKLGLGARPVPASALPGQMQTIRQGKLKIPIIDREKLYRKSFLYNSLAAVICGYFMADLLVAGLTPWLPAMEPPRPRIGLQGTQRDFLAYSNVILPRGRPNLFNEKGLVPDNDESGGGIGGPPVKTSLPLNLLGVIVIQDGKKSVASVEDKGVNQVLAVRAGDSITRTTVVEQITDSRVIFLNHDTGRREFVELPQDQILARRAAPTKPSPAGGIQKASETHYTIDRKEIDNVTANMATVLQDARCVPELENGRPAGYRCFQITPGSIYDKLGLKENDVICGMNGESINDPSRAFQILSSLKDPSTRNISICIKRNGAISNYQYDIN